MDSLFDYAAALTSRAQKSLKAGEVFAKVLTQNDDSGRHGVLIPTDAYSYFPYFAISDPTKNETIEFSAFDAISRTSKTLGYKYYERYPERRVTRLNGLLNDTSKAPRLLVFLHATHSDGSTGLYFDCANTGDAGRFYPLFHLIFGNEVAPVAGNFIVRPVESDAFAIDETLSDLLGKFDEVKSRGWIDSLRIGDTGIGYTFETLLGIEENNDQIADFHGIEIKCKGAKESDASHAGKINLFQSGPKWTSPMSARERIRVLGQQGPSGLFSCYSQVTTTPNNLGLLLDVLEADEKIDLRKYADDLGYWSFDQLRDRLAEKHSRAVFVKAKSRPSPAGTQYLYNELVYCDRPSMDRFLELVMHRNIVFEFTMSEKLDGRIRNHGYPWRLIRAQFLEHLFAFQIKLR